MPTSRLKLGLVMLLLSSCSNPIEDEQERLDMVKTNGSVEEVCQQARKVSDAALASKDERYAELHTMADINCMTAEQNPGASYDQVTNASATVIQADNMDAIADTTTPPS